MQFKSFNEWLHDQSVYRIDSPHELGTDCASVRAIDVWQPLPRPCARYIGDAFSALYYRIDAHNLARVLTAVAGKPVTIAEALAALAESTEQ